MKIMKQITIMKPTKKNNKTKKEVMKEYNHWCCESNEDTERLAEKEST